jgi:hypothetical protein
MVVAEKFQSNRPFSQRVLERITAMDVRIPMGVMMGCNQQRKIYILDGRSISIDRLT